MTYIQETDVFQSDSSRVCYIKWWVLGGANWYKPITKYQLQKLNTPGCMKAYPRTSFPWKFVICILYPFHITKFAVTPHWTPLSIHPLCCCYTPVCFGLLSHRISAFWQVRFKKRSKIEQKNIITPMHCLAFPSALFGAPFHIENRTVANCGFWLEYASKTPLEVVADLPRRMRLFWLRSQIMRLQSVHIKLHYSQNAFDSTLLAWYERGIKPFRYGVLFPPLT